jgi:hypothetical protein
MLSALAYSRLDGCWHRLNIIDPSAARDFREKFKAHNGFPLYACFIEGTYLVVIPAPARNMKIRIEGIRRVVG